MLIKERLPDEGVGLDTLEWKEFPSSYHTGGLEWKLLHVAPEAPAFTVMFRAVKDVTARPHIHQGPAFVYQLNGEVKIHDMIINGPAFGYEAAGADHPCTFFKEGTEFFMVMFGPLDFYSEDGQHVVINWKDAQDVWAEQNGQAAS